MTKNIQSLSKWIPLEILEFEQTFTRCRGLKTTCLCLVHRANNLLSNIRKNQRASNQVPLGEDNLQFQEIEDIASSMESIVDNFEETLSEFKINNNVPVVSSKTKRSKEMLWKAKLALTYIIQELVSQIADWFVYSGENILVLTLRISTSYNSLLTMDSKYNLSQNISICNNTCPYLMFPMKKFSVTRLLQILAFKRAEMCCHKLIDCLLETYKAYDDDDDKSSDNSSLEIYIALTKHMSPPMEIETQVKNKQNEHFEDIDHSGAFSNLENLITEEETNVLNLLAITLKAAPSMLGNDAIKKSKNNGIQKISSKARQKVLDYYEQILWAEVGNYLEHVILWWAPSPLACRPPHSSQHLREWITQFVPTGWIQLHKLGCLA